MSPIAKRADVTKQPDPLTLNDVDLSHRTDVINTVIDFSDNSVPSDLPLPEMVFDWFSTDSNIALTLSTDFFPSNNIPPPSPLRFKNTLLQFWPLSTSKLANKANDYKLIYDIVHETGLPNYMEAKIPIPSGLNIKAWRDLLVNYPDEALVDHLEYDWPIDYTKPTPPTP